MGVNSWEVSDEFWIRVKPLIPPKPERDPTKTFIRKPCGGRKPKPARVVTSNATPKNGLAAG